MGIGQPVPEKKIFEGRLPYYGRGGHLGHVTSIMSSNFQAFIHSFVPNGTAVSEKIWFEYLYVHDLGKGQEMTLTFNLTYLHEFN